MRRLIDLEQRDAAGLPFYYSEHDLASLHFFNMKTRRMRTTTCRSPTTSLGTVRMCFCETGTQ